MTRLLRAVLLLTFAATPALLTAQGGRGGMGGGMGAGGGGRGRGQRSQGDTTATGTPRAQLSFAELVFAHRSELQLTDSQTIKVSGIRMVAMSRRAVLNNQLDSVKSAMVVTPADGATPPTDSSRKAIMERRRALGSVLGELHDVDVNARNETLVVLTPAQQKKAEQLQETTDSPAPTNGASERGSGRRGGGRPGGGMGVPLRSVD